MPTLNHKIRLLTICLAGELAEKEIPLFRGAVLGSMGAEADVLYHNHIGKDGFRYRYPLIQYKRLHGHPAIVCIGEGVDAIQPFLNSEARTLRLGNRLMTTKIQERRYSDFEITATDSLCHYSLRQWLPLNENNYKTYMQEDSLIGQISLLERILTGNILSMLKGLDLTAMFPIQISITKLDPLYYVVYKNTSHAAFDISFTANLLMPDHIGLGKNVSVGFGSLNRVSINR